MSAVRVRHRPPAFAAKQRKAARRSFSEGGLVKFRSFAGMPAFDREGCPSKPEHPSAAIRSAADLMKRVVQKRCPQTRACRHTDSLSSFAARKATFLLALIWIGSPVAGLRPDRAALCLTSRVPRPLILIR